MTISSCTNLWMQISSCPVLSADDINSGILYTLSYFKTLDALTGIRGLLNALNIYIYIYIYICI